MIHLIEIASVYALAEIRLRYTDNQFYSLLNNKITLSQNNDKANVLTSFFKCVFDHITEIWNVKITNVSYRTFLSDTHLSHAIHCACVCVCELDL